MIAAFDAGAGSWRAVPVEFEGDVFAVNGRYYHGGYYEEGDFVFDGRRYSCRYIYNGHYLYGGSLAHCSKGVLCATDHHRDTEQHGRQVLAQAQLGLKSP